MRIKIAYRFILCLVAVFTTFLPAPGQRPLLRRTTQQRQPRMRNQPTRSPAESIARAYAAGLAENNFAPLWQHSTSYGIQVQLAVKDLPRSMWADKIRSIQQEWLGEIQLDRDTTNTSSRRPCWVYFRPGVTYEFVEARDAAAFFHVSYSTESVSPLFMRGELYRKLKEATLIMHLTTPQPQCDIVAGTENDFPPPGLTKERAFEIVKNFELPVDDQPSIDFYYSLLQPPLNHYKEFIGILNKYGVEASNLSFLYGKLHELNLRSPANWDKYRLPIEHWQGMWVYALVESRPVEIVEFEQKEEKVAVVTIRITFKGCTPICELVRDLRSFDSKYGLDMDKSVRIFWSKGGYQYQEWPQEQIRQVFLYKDGYASWSVRGYSSP